MNCGTHPSPLGLLDCSGCLFSVFALVFYCFACLLGLVWEFSLKLFCFAGELAGAEVGRGCMIGNLQRINES